MAKKTCAPSDDDEPRRKPRKKVTLGGDELRKRAAQNHRDKMASNSRENYDSVAEIGEILPVKDKKRRERCKNDLHQFLVEYFPGSTGLHPFSDDHRRVIARLQEACLKGGRFFNLVYRGFGKTTISENCCIWAALNGHRKLIVLIGANRNAAKDLLDAIKSELETNERLQQDFPEVCQAIAALEGKNQRCASQTCGGELTHIAWTKERVVLPTIAGSAASGATIVTRGITSSIRGIGQRHADGTQQRPDIVICDDLQTDQSAASAMQVRKRLMTLSKSILKLAGHTSTIACVVNGTIIERDDLMDRLRDPIQYPGWQGETVKMMLTASEAHETLWMGDYARIRRSFDPVQPGDCDRARREANEFYRQNRLEMDRGCRVGWQYCYDPDLEVSAIQHAYNFLIDDGQEVFAAECQSEPLRGEAEAAQLELKDIIHKLSGYKHREVPVDASRLTCFIDTQDESFWYVVMAWTPNFTGHVIDYGCWPKSSSRDASKKTLRSTLSKVYAQYQNKEARWRAGLSDLCDAVLGQEWFDTDMRPHAIDCAFVDVADGDSALPIRSWVRASKWSKILRCSMGLGLKPADTPLGERKKADDEVRRGLNWCEKKDKKVRGGTITWIDTNFWKSFVANRWRAASPRPKDDRSFRPSEPGAIYLYGLDAHTHSTFGIHQTSEYRTRMLHEKSGRTIDFWSLKPNRPDNEFWDGLVGNCVLADAAGGIALKDAGLKSVPRPQRRGPRRATKLDW